VKTKTKKHSDLCSTCDDGFSCNHSKLHQNPVIQCEEFSCAPTPSNKNDKESKMSNTDSREKNNPNNYKGLCANCENSKTCTIDKPEGGIWHCEEYH